MVVWQVSQAAIVWICVPGIPVARTRSWQLAQALGVPAKTPLVWHDSQGTAECAPVSAKPVRK